MKQLTITLKKTETCWLAKFSDENPSEFIPAAFSNRADVNFVIERLSQNPRNKNAKFVILT